MKTIVILLFLTIIACGCGRANGDLVVNRIFVAEGQASPFIGGFGGPGGAAPTAIAGGGNLNQIFNMAADAWENIIDADRTVDMYYTWQNRSGGMLGSALSATTGGQPAPSSAYIRFDNDEIGGTTRSWFLDSNPLDNSEYSSQTDFSADLGGGSMNVGRVFGGASGDAANNFDLYTVALHEIGHALGWVNGATGFSDPLILRSDLAHAGAQIRTIAGGHAHPSFHSQALMAPTASFGSRSLISDLDALGLAQITGDNTFIGVPEPNTTTFAAFIAVTFLFRRPTKRNAPCNV